jgi:hypothetical protein
MPRRLIDQSITVILATAGPNPRSHLMRLRLLGRFQGLKNFRGNLVDQFRHPRSEEGACWAGLFESLLAKDCSISKAGEFDLRINP